MMGQMGKKKIYWNSIFAMLMYALLIAALMVLLYAGAVIFKTENSNRIDSSDGRKITAYISNKLAAGDEEEKILVLKMDSDGSNLREEEPVKTSFGDEVKGNVLAIEEGETGYRTLIYILKGYLYEELAPDGKDPDISAASKICKADSMRIIKMDNLVEVDIDGKRSIYTIRSEEQENR